MPLAVEGINCPLLRGTQYAALSAGKKENIVDKEEITNLPEGMTSEELDALTTGEDPPEKVEQDLAQEALNATDSPAEETVSETEEEELSEDQQQLRAKDSKIASQKHELKERDLENARLLGQIEARKELAAPEVPVKSPLEIAEAAYLEEHDDLEGFAMSGKLYRVQKAFEDEQTATKVAASEQTRGNNAAVQAEDELLTGELSEEQRGKGLDLKTVTGIGKQYLTRGDILDIQDTAQSRGEKAALKVAYDRMVQRTLAAGNEDSKLLKSAISKSQTKPKKEKTGIDALTTAGEEKGEAEEDTHSSRLANFVCN